MEYERRAAIVASFRAGKKPTQVIGWFGFKRSMVMEIWKQWNACENKNNFTANGKPHDVCPSGIITNDEFVAAVKKKVDNDGSQSYAKIAADMGCHKSTICRTIKAIGYSKTHPKLIGNISKESRKIKATALLNKHKHGSTDIKNFDLDQNN